MDTPITLIVPGAEVIAYAKKSNGQEYVTAYLPDNDATPYATWSLGASHTHGRACYLGHYFRNRKEAMQDMVERAS